jgi:hypothetical protein
MIDPIFDMPIRSQKIDSVPRSALCQVETRALQQKVAVGRLDLATQ